MPKDPTRFELTILPHLDAAFNFARWLTHNNEDAADIVQEACLRALKYFEGFRGGNARAWLLTIVRNIYYTINSNQAKFEFRSNQNDHAVEINSYEFNPETIYLKNENLVLLNKALEELPLEFREVIILRELEGLNYKEIANVTDIPIGTVMSRLSRGRKILLKYLNNYYRKEV